MYALPLYWPGRGAKANRPQEDQSISDPVNGIFIVADGVTRTRYGANSLSPAARAAYAFNQVFHQFLSALREPPTLTTLHQAARAGNHAVEGVNQELDLWENHDYYERDYAGTVAAVIVLTPPTFLYGFMTDCGMGHLSPGRHPFTTPDELARVRRNFPEELAGSELFAFGAIIGIDPMLPSPPMACSREKLAPCITGKWASWNTPLVIHCWFSLMGLARR